MGGDIKYVQDITHVPAPNEMLKEQPDTDIFLLNSIVYRNSKDIDWVQKLALEPGEQVGESIAQHKDNATFQGGMSTKLPVGTKLYQSVHANPIILVEIDDKFVSCLGLVEGCCMFFSFPIKVVSSGFVYSIVQQSYRG